MTLTGGKRKVNKSLKAWVTFVKKVQKEEKLSYKDAIHRAKQRKDKGEKWMTGGENTPNSDNGYDYENPIAESVAESVLEYDDKDLATEKIANEVAEKVLDDEMAGGRRRRRTMRRSRGRSRGRTARRSRRRSSRRH